MRRAVRIAVLTALCAPGIAFGDTPAQKGAGKTAALRAPPKPAGPVAASRAWHTPAAGKNAPVDASGRPLLVLSALNFQTTVALGAKGERGGFSAEDLDRATHALREGSTGNEHPVDPRVLDLVYRVQVHFNAQEVRIISGYRTPRGVSRSNHGKGRAIDLVVPGTSDEEVAKFAREQGFVGVGIYPESGFVHLDVRERSYFWVDTSGPGKRSRMRGILADLAAKSDAAATARGEHAIGPFQIGSDVDAAIGAASSKGTSPGTNEDDDIDDPP
jgi:uncharacterized protein YcbK (DUF882 family)